MGATTQCPMVPLWQDRASSTVLGAEPILSALLWRIHVTLGPERCIDSCRCLCSSAPAVARRGSGTLLYGPAGCGKTLIARGLAEMLGLPIHRLDHRAVRPRMGATELALAVQLRKARATAPSVLVIDELQALAPVTALPGSAEYRFVLMLAQELDALCSKSVFVLGLCRQPQHIHPVHAVLVHPATHSSSRRSLPRPPPRLPVQLSLRASSPCQSQSFATFSCCRRSGRPGA